MKKSLINKYNSLPLPKKLNGKEYNKCVTKMVSDELLQITVYINNCPNPNIDIFIDKENEDWLSRVYSLSEAPRFSVASLDRLLSYTGDFIFSDVELMKKIFCNENITLSSIYSWQWQIRRMQHNAILKKKFDKWDEELSIFPKTVMPAFKKMMAKEADKHYFMFYENAESTTGFCSHCKKEVSLKKVPKQNAECRCPSCRKKAVFKRQNQIQTLATYYYNGAYAQKVGDTIIIRMFYGRQYYRGRDYKTPNILLNESVRYILYRDGKTVRYWYGTYNNEHTRWIKSTTEEAWTYISKYGSCGLQNIDNIYANNLTSVMKHSAWNLWKKKPTNGIHYLIIENQTKGVVEKLAKLGLLNIALEFASDSSSVSFENAVNLKGKDFAQVLKIDKARLKRLCEKDDVEYYRWLIKEKEQNTIFDDDVIRDFSEMKISDYQFSKLPPQMSYKQIHNYMVKQSKLCGEPLKEVLSKWIDYYDLAKGNNWNIQSIVFYAPSNLKEMHDKAVTFKDGKEIESEVADIEQKWPEVNNTLELMKPFAYENNEYCIVVPKNVEDIVKEGHCLQHCIHKVPFYFDKMTNRETYIFFLRKKSNPNLSWYTLEVEQNGNILQKRTTSDNQNEDLNAALPFLKEYQQFFKNQMTEDDKLLGVKAEEARKKHYQELREQKNKVWHGKFAGQLLADILEADIMIA